jgi:hypothetical protein
VRAVTRRALLRGAVALLLALAGVMAGAAPACAQGGEARLELVLGARTGQGEGPQIVASRVLADTELRELLRSGFPARLHFRCELWRDERLNNVRDAAVEWDVVVRYDPLERKYDTYRVIGDRATRTGRFDTVAEMEAFIDRPYRIGAPPMRRGRSYYYEASLDVEVLSVRDLDEVEQWLRGTPGERDAGSTIGRTMRGLLARLLGGERRSYAARSPRFRAE